MSRPAVSIVMPTYNRLTYLRDAVDSIFAQTITAWELIVVDDGSDVETLDYLRSLESDARVRVFCRAHSGTPSAPRNVGIREAHAPLISFMDSDDLWESTKLERQLAMMDARPECGWSYTAFVIVDGAGAVLPSERNRRWTPYAGYIFEQTVRTTASIRTPSVVVRTELVRALGGFDETIDCSDDYDLWMRLALESPVCLVDEPLVRVRRHDENLKRSVEAPYMARDYSLRKLARCVPREHRALVEHERSRNALAMAAAIYRLRGRWASIARLAECVPFCWTYGDWWYGAARAVARACIGARPKQRDEPLRPS